MTQTQTAISPQDAVLKALAWQKARPDSKGPGLHTVYSGLSQVLRDRYPDLKAEGAVTALYRRMETEGRIKSRPAKGGFILYLPADAPKSMTKVEDLTRAMFGTSAQA
jgi:hypothetical protein